MRVSTPACVRVSATSFALSLALLLASFSAPGAASAKEPSAPGAGRPNAPWTIAWAVDATIEGRAATGETAAIALPGRPTSIAFARSGRLYVATAPDAAGVSLIGAWEANGAAVPQATPTVCKGHVRAFDVSEDEKWIVVAEAQADSAFLPGRLVLIERARPENRKVVADGSQEIVIAYNDPRFLPGDKEIVVTSMQTEVDPPRMITSSLARIDLGSGKVTELCGGQVTFSADGVRSGFRASIPSVTDKGSIVYLQGFDRFEAKAVLLNPVDGTSTDVGAPFALPARIALSRDGARMGRLTWDDEGNPSLSLVEIAAGKSVELSKRAQIFAIR